MKVQTVIKNYWALSDEDKKIFQERTCLKNMPWWCDECPQKEYS